MTKKYRKDFKNSSKCWTCKKAYEKGEVKVKDHDQITGNIENLHIKDVI